jgi:3-mercaptopyruvate sulfurtransferase SseA
VVIPDCPGDEPGYQTVRVLQAHGLNGVHKLFGGFDAYLEAGLTVEPITKSVPATRILLLWMY